MSPGEGVRNFYRRQGADQERARIIDILNEYANSGHLEECHQDRDEPNPDDCVCFNHKEAQTLIAFIKGENK